MAQMAGSVTDDDKPPATFCPGKRHLCAPIQTRWTLGNALLGATACWAPRCPVVEVELYRLVFSANGGGESGGKVGRDTNVVGGRTWVGCGSSACLRYRWRAHVLVWEEHDFGNFYTAFPKLKLLTPAIRTNILLARLCRSKGSVSRVPCNRVDPEGTDVQTTIHHPCPGAAG